MTFKKHRSFTHVASKDDTFSAYLHSADMKLDQRRPCPWLQSWASPVYFPALVLHCQNPVQLGTMSLSILELPTADHSGNYSLEFWLLITPYQSVVGFPFLWK